MDTIKLDTVPTFNFTYYQISNFDFCVSFVDKNNKVLTTPTPCKDYLQDIIWSETTGKSIDVYGLKWKQGNFDITTPTTKLALFGGLVKLNGMVENMQVFLNHFDKAQGMEPSKIYLTEDDKVIVVEFDSNWTKGGGPLISAFTTAIRVCGLYTGEAPIDYLKKVFDAYKKTKSIKPDYMKVEVARLETNLKKLAALLAGMKTKYSWHDIDGHNFYEVHSYGITNCYDFPAVSI